jgi:hypothetical protein
MTATSVEIDHILISADELRAQIDSDRDVVVLEVRRDADGAAPTHSVRWRPEPNPAESPTVRTFLNHRTEYR